MEFVTKEPERQFQFIDELKKWFAEQCKEAGRVLTYNIQTFGCQMNAKDSEKLAGILENIGYVETDTENADFVIYNTCTVRENANSRVYGRIGYLGTLKKKNPFMKIALCGCMMQEKHVVERIQKSYRFVDIVFGTYNIYMLAELLYNNVNSRQRRTEVEIWDEARGIVEDLPSSHKFSFKAGVNIMYGCDNFCSYCIVPYVRGRERSRNKNDIIKEVQCLAGEGIIEIMLLGQNVNSYGKGLEEPCSFAELLREVCKVPGIERVRFMTSHPKDLSDDIIAVMKEEPKVCSHLHLPMQSGSTEILRKMNRKYTKDDYLSLVDKIRKELPEVSLTTDIIVGFPGETDEDFNETIDVVRKCKFDSAFTFIYSKRTGTVAARMENEVPEDVIKERFDRLLEVCKEVSEENILKLQGRNLPVLVEEKDDNQEGYLTGRLSNNILVHFKGCDQLIGKIVDVNLAECKGFYFIGELLKNT